MLTILLHFSLCGGAIVAPDRPAMAPLPTMASLRQEAAALLAPHTSADGADVEAILGEVREAMRKVADALEDGINDVEVVYDDLLLGAAAREPADAAARQRRALATRTALEQLATLGAFDRLATIRVPIVPPEVHIGGATDGRRDRARSAGSSASRRVAMLLAARNAEALRRGDREAFVRGTDDLGKLARAQSVCIGQIGHLAASAVEQLMLTQVRFAIASGLLDEPSLAALQMLLDQPAVLPLSFAMRGEALVALESTLELAESVDKELKEEQGIVDPAPGARLDPGMPLLPDGPALEPQIALTRRAFTEWAAIAQLAPGARPARRAAEAELWRAVGTNMLLDSLLGVNSRIFDAADSMNARRAGTRTLIALERFKLARGAYPESLAELVPDFLSELPLDPYTGEALGYLPPSTGPHAGGPGGASRAFVLYAAGSDLKDNGGIVDFTTTYNPDPARSGGQDMPLNTELPE